jgi:hypothetical protein
MAAATRPASVSSPSSPNEPAQLALVPAVHYVCRRDAEVRVGAHIQWAFRAKAEASPLISELERGETEVKEDAVERREAVARSHDVEKREVGSDEDRALSETCEKRGELRRALRGPHRGR